MSNHDEHFDELDAVRRFPSEDTWLDQPMPDLQDDAGLLHEIGSADAVGPQSGSKDVGSQNAGSQNAGPNGSTSFADRVMQARQDDLDLDAQIAELDQALPTELLQQFGAPKPSDTFVDQTVRKLTQERKQRWQEMLSRHVAPEPSTEFVSRTLAALQDDGSSAIGSSAIGSSAIGSSATGSSATGSRAIGGRAIGSKKTNRYPQLPAPRDYSKRGQNWTVFGLVATAAAALLWVSLTGDIRQPLELRLADQASPAVAYASSTSPMSAILARVAHDEEPFAMFDEPADGLWLASDRDSKELR
ncbi:MAG: hypothetical protein ACJA0V_001602 [Planctomycetota bacterium]|jgi:hypothetical protein